MLNMDTKTISLLLVLLVSLTISTCRGSEPSIRHQIHLLRPQTGSSGHPHSGLSCLSWRLGVETNNIIKWTTVPIECESYVGHYLLGHQYRLDSRTVVDQALTYANGLSLTGSGKDIWVFDIDETSLSNLPYYATHGFGTTIYNDTSFNEWVVGAKAPALPESLRLYNKLLALGIKVVFLTGRGDAQTSATAANLKSAGFHTWLKLILKSSPYSGKTSLYYKSAERTKLVKKGYTIVGNIGDQWSDILGDNGGARTFKLPDPLYYIS